MTYYQWVEILSSAFGAIGTTILFINSYSVQPLEGAPFNSSALEEYNRLIKNKNINRMKFQRVGFGLICVSFILQAVSVFL
jgi:hypothetical protein